MQYILIILNIISITISLVLLKKFRNIEGYNTYKSDDSDYSDDLYEDAKKVVIENKKASTSLLQRKLRIGYSRAARLIDMLEDNGVIGEKSNPK